MCPRYALQALLLPGFLFISGLAAAAAGQTATARPVARLLSSSGERVPGRSSRCVLYAAAKSAASHHAVAPSSLELRAFELINERRRAEGLPALAWDGDLAHMARQHSDDMARREFFNHVDPDGRDMSERACALGVAGWSAMGENIAYNQGFDDPAAFAVERWLGSTKHRDNVLRTAYTHTAVGAARGADGRLYFTQVFANR